MKMASPSEESSDQSSPYRPREEGEGEESVSLHSVCQPAAVPQLTLRRPIYNERTFGEIFPPQNPPRASTYKLCRSFRSKKLTSQAFKRFIYKIVPIVYWLPRYKVKEDLFEDCLAGLTVGVLRIPHGMAHAVLATLSPVYGLYTNIFPQLIYAVFGTSKHVSIGTMAVISIMVGDAVQKAYEGLYGEEGMMDPPKDEAKERARIASTLALMVGFMQVAHSYYIVIKGVGEQIFQGFLMGLLRVGIITNYLPEPLVRGFTTGAACHVFCSQFNHLFGIELERYTGPFSLIRSYKPFLLNLGLTNPITLLVSIASLVILVSVKEFQDCIKERFKWQLPVEMLVVVLGTLVSHLFNLGGKKVAIVGYIPNGLPTPYAPSFTYASALLPDAIILSVVSYALVISLSNIFAKKHKYEVSANQELFAFATSHILSSTLYCYPTTSSLSRTLVRDIAGGKTMVAGATSTILVLIVVLFVGRYLSPLPACCLAAIIVVALRGMFRQLTDIKTLWKYSKIDMSIWLVTFVSTVLLGLDYGLAIGVGYSIFTVVLRSQWPQSCMLGQFGETGLYGDMETFPDARRVPGVKIFRIQSPLFFANAAYLKKALRLPPGSISGSNKQLETQKANDHVNHYTTLQVNNDGLNHRKAANNTDRSTESSTLGNDDTDQTIHTLIIDLSGVSFVDTVALNTLEAIAKDHLSAGVKVYFAECRGNVQQMIFLSGLVKSINLDHIFLTVHDAVLYSQSVRTANQEVSSEAEPTYMSDGVAVADSIC